MLRSTCFALMLVTAAAAGAVQAPTNAPATTPNSTTAPAANTAEANKPATKTDLDKIVCEKQETTGSRLGAKKVCLTVAQWLEFKRDEQDQLQHLQSNLGIASH